MTLSELLAPLTIADLRALLRVRALEFGAGTDPERFRDVLSWKALKGLLDNSKVPVERMRVTRDRQNLPSILYSERGKVSPAKFDKLLANGVSVVVEPIDPYVPALDRICTELRREIPESIKAGAIGTTGEGGAFETHYDPEDLIILQVEGHKRWMVYGPQVSNPVRGMTKPEVPESAPVFDKVLTAGDLLFLPAGHWHRCENTSDLSLHIGLFIKPPTAWANLEAVLNDLIDDELFRIPLSRFASHEDRQQHDARIRARLRARLLNSDQEKKRPPEA